jgi:SAM-dependent methyltransferase
MLGEEGSVEGPTGWMPFSNESDPLPHQVAPHATTSQSLIQAAFDLLPSGVHGDSDVLLDLGCGDGRIVNFAASKYGMRGFGVDLNQELLAMARKTSQELHVERLVSFLECSFLDDKFDFSLPCMVDDANQWNGPNIITIYLTYDFAHTLNTITQFSITITSLIFYYYIDQKH